MRIHGEVKIKRKAIIEQKKDYHKYIDDLKDDFKETCGYCGKNSRMMREKFVIDHFVPQKIDVSRVNDYTNLVLSCQKCNRGKWHYWPTNDKNISHNGVEGFVDPTLDDFDNHLERNDGGHIIAKSKVGNYMFEKLRFDIRPINMVWKVMILKRQQTKLKNFIRDNKTYTNLSDYFEITKEIDEIMDILFERDEMR